MILVALALLLTYNVIVAYLVVTSWLWRTKQIERSQSPAEGGTQALPRVVDYLYGTARDMEDTA